MEIFFGASVHLTPVSSYLSNLEAIDPYHVYTGNELSLEAIEPEYVDLIKVGSTIKRCTLRNV